MKLIITASIYKTEFKPFKAVFSLEAIKAVARKSLEGLGNDIKSPFKIPFTCLKKMYLTSSGGAGRAVFLLEINSVKSLLVLLRLKNDKKIGSNMTIKNIHFKHTLNRNLELILKDLRSGDYEAYDL